MYFSVRLFVSLKMANQTLNATTLTNTVTQLKQQIEKAVDVKKLFEDNNFLAKLKKLPQLQQLQIFGQFKDKFTEISKDPGSAITNWTQNLPDLATARETLESGLQQGQNFIQDFSKSLN